MAHHLTLFLIFLYLSSPVPLAAQDERYYRQLITGELPRFGEDAPPKTDPKFVVTGGAYLIDLNSDGIEETIVPEKRDGVDWIVLRDFSQRKVFEGKLTAMGANSHIYKIRLVHLTPTVKTLILFLDEGVTQGRRFESTGRIYLLTFEKNDLSSLKLEIGPHHFHEREAPRDQYWRRDYLVSVVDLDGDGSREIVVQYNHIQRIMKYLGSGVWLRY